jgi:hypothetical protein
MFDFLDDLAKGVGNIIGTAVGSIAGISSVIIGTTLGITVDMVDEAINNGCTTYEEIKNYVEGK